MTSKEKNGDYTLQVCDSLWLNRSFREEIRKKIAEAPLKDKSYRYSDVGFILLQMLAEELSGKPMDEYLWQEFYQPMGLEHTAYLPLRYFDKKEVVPSAVDRFLRKTTLQGFVHDESAAFQGEFRVMRGFSLMLVKSDVFIRCCSMEVSWMEDVISARKLVLYSLPKSLKSAVAV